MGRAFRYQRRLTHIILSVAERAAKADLVTRAEEPKAAAKSTKASKPAAKKAASATKKKASVKA
jgi:large subunit ribosomal protein L22